MQEYVSDFVGKPLLTRSGERVGYIKNVQTDAKLTRIRNLECCDEEEEEFSLPLSAIAQAGKDAVIVKGLAAKPCTGCRPAPFGAQVYAETGELLGTAADFLREGNALTGILLSDGTQLPADRLAGMQDAAMISLTSPAKRPPRPKKQAKETKPVQTESAPEEGEGGALPCPAQPETGENAAEETAESAPSEKAAARTVQNVAETLPPPRRAGGMRAGSALLTGKILPEDLTDVRGNVLARAGTTVTAEIISRAMAHDKLFALTLLCCKDGYGR